MFNDTAMMASGNNGGNEMSMGDMVASLLRVSENNNNAIAQFTGFMKQTSQYMADFSDRLENIDSRMFNLENNEEVTTAQLNKIIEAKNKRIREILYDKTEYNVCSHIFYARIITEARKHAGLGYPMQCTKKANYQRIIDFMECWVPDCGIATLKSQAYENREFRRHEKENL